MFKRIWKWLTGKRKKTIRLDPSSPGPRPDLPVVTESDEDRRKARNRRRSERARHARRLREKQPQVVRQDTFERMREKALADPESYLSRIRQAELEREVEPDENEDAPEQTEQPEQNAKARQRAADLKLIEKIQRAG